MRVPLVHSAAPMPFLQRHRSALKRNACYTDNHSRIRVNERISYEFYMISKSWEELKFLSRYKILTSWKDTTQVSNFTWQ